MRLVLGCGLGCRLGAGGRVQASGWFGCDGGWGGYKFGKIGGEWHSIVGPGKC